MGGNQKNTHTFGILIACICIAVIENVSKQMILILNL
jgi:hypothetical protein